MVAGGDTGQKASLVSPTITSREERCVEFYYFMYGPDVGSLRVYTRLSTGFLTEIWHVRGNQGRKWHRGFAKVSSGIYQFVFEAEMKGGKRNAIALDDVTIQKCAINGEKTFTF